MGGLFSKRNGETGEMPTSQNHAWWEAGQQIPEGPSPAALMVTELETQIGKGTQGPKTAIPSHLSSSSTSPPTAGEPSGVSQLPEGQTTHPVTLSCRPRRKKEPENWVLHRKVCDKTVRAESDPLPKKQVPSRN